MRDPRPRKPDSTLLLALLLPVFAWAPLTYPGYFVFRSGFLPIFNLVDSVSHFGELSWMPTIGAGYRLLGGEGWLPYLLGAIPAALGATPTEAIKVVFALSLVAGSVGAYAWLRRHVTDGWAALAGASVYVFSPIWMAAIYVRGAFAEAVLLGLFSWVLWAADAAVGGAWKAIPVLMLLAAACMWTYPTLGFVFLVLVLVYLLILRMAQKAPPRDLALAATGLAGGIVVGALGLLPAMLQRGVGEVEPVQASEWTVLLTPWLALFAGWIAGKLGAMLPEQTEGVRPALFASIIALVLLGAYTNLHPVTYAGSIPSRPLAIFGQNEIALLNVETEGTPGPGGRVALEVEWQALRPLSRDYTVFFHVLAGDDQRYGQVDTMPQAGKLPTTQWEPGQVIQDRYEATVSPDAPIDAQYRYWLGWYQGETGQRLPLGQVLSEGSDTSAGEDDKYVVTP